MKINSRPLGAVRMLGVYGTKYVVGSLCTFHGAHGNIVDWLNGGVQVSYVVHLRDNGTVSSPDFLSGRC